MQNYVYRVNSISNEKPNPADEYSWIENYTNVQPGGSQMYPRLGLPAPYRRAEEKDFYNMMKTYTPELIEKRDVWVPELGSREALDAVIFYFYGEAYAVVVDRHGVDLWFKVGCEHEWKTVDKRMCYYEAVCVKCGIRHVVDSSD